MKKLFTTSLLATLLFASTALAFERPSVPGYPGTDARIHQLMPEPGHNRQGNNFAPEPGHDRQGDN